MPRKTQTPSARAGVGDRFPDLGLAAISGETVPIPDPDGALTHLQFRRFAGCPICNLHLRSVSARIEEIGVPLPPNLMDHLRQLESPEILSDVVSAAFVTEPFQRQQLLEAHEVCDRLRLLIQLLRSQAG